MFRNIKSFTYAFCVGQITELNPEMKGTHGLRGVGSERILEKNARKYTLFHSDNEFARNTKYCGVGINTERDR